ncbi:MAG: four helix bundle protein [Verrucomicrobia bacterium]|nr:four helix bundle protein [Verrucomicrobiota bacterium]
MEAAAKTYKSFERLEVYRTAREFRKKMYDVVKRLPEAEKYGLAGQIRRAAVSITNNIAEGHGRYHYLDNIRFLLQARGSLAELMDDLNVCLDEGYLPPAEVEELKTESFSVYRLVNGYIRYLREQKAGANLQIHESFPPYGAEVLDEVSV